MLHARVNYGLCVCVYYCRLYYICSVVLVCVCVIALLAVDAVGVLMLLCASGVGDRWLCRWVSEHGRAF